MRISSDEHTSRPWRIHEFTPDFRVEDVWALPTPGAGPDDFRRFVREMLAHDFEREGSRIVTTLFAIRWKLGELLGWDKQSEGLGERVPTLLDRLPIDLGATAPQASRRRIGSPRCTCSTTSSPAKSPTRRCTASCI